MEKQRNQEYIDLIEQLLACSSEKEEEIIQTNQDLIDSRFVQAAIQFVHNLEEQARETQAAWLRNLLVRLSQSIEGTSEIEIQFRQATEDSSNFFVEILNCVIQSKAAVQPIYQFLSANQTKIDVSLLSVVPTVIFSLLADADKNKKEYVIAAVGTFGNLIHQFPLGRKPINVELAILLHKQSIKAMGNESTLVDRAKAMINLANAYSDRVRGDRINNIETAIDIYEQALSVITREKMPVIWAHSMMNLASIRRQRILGDRVQSIDVSISEYQLALQELAPNATPQGWGAAMNGLANAYYFRLKGDRAQNIEDAIECYEQALQVRTIDTVPSDWAQSMSNLATAYFSRLRGDHAQNIESAIDSYQQVLRVRTVDSVPDAWAETTNNLAFAYSNRIRGVRSRNIENAISLYEQVLQIRTREVSPREWAETMSNLATAYAMSVHGDRTQHIEDAIAAYRQSLQVIAREVMPVKWATVMNNLANVYRSRIKGKRSQNIAEAIDVYKQSLQVRTREAMPNEWAETMNNLAATYAESSEDDVAQNIENAIKAYQQSLQVRTREAMPNEWAETMNNLAATYSKRVRGSCAQNIEDAIHVCNQALEVLTRENTPINWAGATLNLGFAYSKRVNGEREQNIKEAISACERALDIFQPERLPHNSRMAARLLGNLCAGNQQWKKACHAYTKAIQATEFLYRASLSRRNKESELSEANDLFRCAAYAQAKVGDYRAAAVIVERGRARMLSEALERQRVDIAELERLKPDLFDRYQRAVEPVCHLEHEEIVSSFSPYMDYLRTEEQHLPNGIHQALNAVISDIRQVPGYKKILELPDFSDIERAVQPENPLLYIVSTPNGILILIVYDSNSTDRQSDSIKIAPIFLENTTEDSIRELLTSHEREYSGWFRAYVRRASNYNRWLKTVDEVTHKIWNLFMGKVVARLEELNFSQATLIPTGYLSFLPLHAAWIEDASTATGRRYALDTIEFTYAPNAQSLEATQSVAATISVSSLLAIDEPIPTTADKLPNSEREVNAALIHFPRSQLLKHAQASHGAVLAAITDQNVLHFSCHGRANFNNPLDSGLLMADNEWLTLKDFFSLQLRSVRLAILSACETALPGTELPDEVISIPTGLLQAGIAGVVSSLWSVPELSTMILLSRFYTLWREHNLKPAQALVKAQKWLRDAEAPEIVAQCKTFIPELSSSSGQLSVQGEELTRQLRFDYSHPHHWAAFSYIGS